MRSLANAVAQSSKAAMAFTENGAITNVSTGLKVLDFFSTAGAQRKNPELAVQSFRTAFAEYPKYAAQTLLWLRDIRQGAGEREIFRKILKDNEQNMEFRPYMERIIRHTPEIGRWDDLLIFSDPILRDFALDVFKLGLADGNALAAKWLPRKGKEVPAIRRAFGLTPKAYRKLIVGLTKVVETQMCSGEWGNINYSHVPSVAAARYQRAFAKHDPEGYKKYREALIKKTDPKVKINASAIYPYDVLKSLFHGDEGIAQAQWDALPNFIGDTPRNILAIADTSGSMGGSQYSLNSGSVEPIDVAVSLALYVATKNTGAMKDLVFTFEGKPKAINLSGSLKQKVRQIMDERKAENTNLQASFDLLLKLAVDNQIPPAEMPEFVLIISDMEFDSGTMVSAEWNYKINNWSKGQTRNHDLIIEKYRKAGYQIPKIVYWNVSSRSNKNKPVTMKDANTAEVSGLSPSIMKTILSNNLENFSPLNVMMETIEKDRYAIFQDL